MITLADHPRAQRGIRRTRAGTGLALAAITALLAHRAGVMADEVVVRALIAGMVGHLLGWAGAIVAYQALAKGEIQAALNRRAARVDDAKRELDRRIETNR